MCIIIHVVELLIKDSPNKITFNRVKFPSRIALIMICFWPPKRDNWLFYYRGNSPLLRIPTVCPAGSLPLADTLCLLMILTAYSSLVCLSTHLFTTLNAPLQKSTSSGSSVVDTEIIASKNSLAKILSNFVSLRKGYLGVHDDQ